VSLLSHPVFLAKQSVGNEKGPPSPWIAARAGLFYRFARPLRWRGLYDLAGVDVIIV